MDIRVLRYFLTVAREGTITRAAESLHIAQPSLSKQLMELEAQLGKPLLIRGKRKITLTEDGVLLRKRAEEIVSLLEKTEQELTADHGTLSGEIAVGGMPIPSLLHAAAEMRQQHPELRFNFYSGDAAAVTECLDHGSLDFAVLLEPVGELKVTVPDSYMGDVIGDLNKRRGRVMGMDPTGDGEQVITAEVPMAEILKSAEFTSVDLSPMRGPRRARSGLWGDVPAGSPGEGHRRGEGPPGGGGEVSKAVRVSPPGVRRPSILPEAKS